VQTAADSIRFKSQTDQVRGVEMVEGLLARQRHILDSTNSPVNSVHHRQLELNLFAVSLAVETKTVRLVAAGALVCVPDSPRWKCR
jgi:hypothetical protein